MKRKTFLVLIVEDSAVTRELFKKALRSNEKNRFEFLEAPDGQKAVELLYQISPDIIFTDYNMPVMNGFDLIKKIKRNRALNSTPIIVMTADENESTMDLFKDFDKIDFLNKPFLPEQLNTLINRNLYS